MTKRSIAALVFALMIATTLGLARAEPFTVADVAGRWAGVETGTFLAQPFAANYVLDVDRSGNASLSLDSTSGPISATCTVLVQTTGFLIAHCVDTSGPITGATYDAHFVVTDRGRKITGWLSVPGLGYFTTTTAYGQ